MTTMVYFDTLLYVKTLKSSGVSENQAEAMAKAQQEALAECLDTTLATKTDITDVKNSILKLDGRVDKVESEIKWVRWILSLVAVGVSTLVLKAFF